MKALALLPLLAVVITASATERIAFDSVSASFPWDGRLDCVFTQSGFESGGDYRGVFTLSVDRDGGIVDSRVLTNALVASDGVFTNRFDCAMLFGEGVYRVGSVRFELLRGASAMPFVSDSAAGGWFAVNAVTLPELDETDGPEDVAAALACVADSRVREEIADVAEYASFRAWAVGVLGPDGAAPAGRRAVADAPGTWLGFALDADRLFASPPSAADFVIGRFAPPDVSGRCELAVTVPGMAFGEVTTSRLESVFALEGSERLDGEFSQQKLESAFAGTGDGRLHFTAGPVDRSVPQFFFRVLLK